MTNKEDKNRLDKVIHVKPGERFTFLPQQRVSDPESEREPGETFIIDQIYFDLEGVGTGRIEVHKFYAGVDTDGVNAVFPAGPNKPMEFIQYFLCIHDQDRSNLNPGVLAATLFYQGQEFKLAPFYDDVELEQRGIAEVIFHCAEPQILLWPNQIGVLQDIQLSITKSITN